MATLNITRDVPIPNAIGVYVDTDNLAPRHRPGDLLCLGLTPASIGDEVACETADGLVVGELIEAHGSSLVLAQCCRLPTGEKFTVQAGRHWPIVGRVVLGSRRTQAKRAGMVKASITATADNDFDLPIWSPWVVIDAPDAPNCDDIRAGHSMKIGGSMTKQQAWDAARSEMNARPEVVAMAVRRDGESL